MTTSNRETPAVIGQVHGQYALSEVVRFLQVAAEEDRRAKGALNVALLAARNAGLSLREMASVMGITKTAVAERLARLDRIGSTNV